MIKIKPPLCFSLSDAGHLITSVEKVLQTMNSDSYSDVRQELAMKELMNRKEKEKDC